MVHKNGLVGLVISSDREGLFSRPKQKYRIPGEAEWTHFSFGWKNFWMPGKRIFPLLNKIDRPPSGGKPFSLYRLMGWSHPRKI